MASSSHLPEENGGKYEVEIMILLIDFNIICRRFVLWWNACGGIMKHVLFCLSYNYIQYNLLMETRGF